jgi:hypothetical protein
MYDGGRFIDSKKAQVGKSLGVSVEVLRWKETRPTRYHNPDLTFRSLSTLTHLPFNLSSSGVVGGLHNRG